ncbi:MAG TPA: ABC transporter permease [Burkholderiaceae bacterium]|jgi:putative ABC transport system permease protein
MRALLSLAWRSAWNRRFVLSLTVFSVSLSAFLLLSIERIRTDVRESFSQSVSGTDLIVGPRTGPAQLLLYAVFRIGSATNNMSYRSVLALAKHRAVAWIVPISLGDSHRGFPVVATTTDYFDRFQYGDHQGLRLAQGRRFDQLFDAVLGSDVAERLGYRIGAHIVLSHGDGSLEGNEHADEPFVVTGILEPTGTPVDRSVHISLQAMEAIHLDWIGGAPMPGLHIAPDQMSNYDLTPHTVTAVLVGLKSRAAVFSVQRWVADFDQEALMGIMPGVTLDELWEVVGIGERALLAITALVSLVSVAGLVAVILAGLNERRRELAILRAVGAGPRYVWLLLATEGGLVTLLGAGLGLVTCLAGVIVLRTWFQQRFGIVLHAGLPSADQWTMLSAVVLFGWLASLLPGWRAYKLSLVDGLTPRI